MLTAWNVYEMKEKKNISDSDIPVYAWKET